MTSVNISAVAGLPAKEWAQLQELLQVYNYHLSKNYTKDKYYEGKISVGSVNLGIALPDGVKNLNIGCAWGAKTVDVLAARSMFDGFVSTDGENVDTLDRITLDNNLIAEYIKACRDELKYGCTFATLSADDAIGCKIRFHSPKTAAALWDGDKGRISCGFAIVDSVPDESEEPTWAPSLINYYTDDAIWVLRRVNEGGGWIGIPYRHNMGRPLMEPMIWNATSNKPFGRSRIKEPIRNLIDGYVRTVANATIGLEFSTTPQKYILGISDDMYDTLINNKFKQYVGSIIAATTNPETGEKPTFGQLTQGNIAPHVEMMRILATQFSAASGLAVTDTGVVNNANPTSAEAVTAQTATLIATAGQLNIGNGDALRTIALMALAIVNKTSIAELSDEERSVMAHFKNPAMPSIAQTADAAIKIASTRPEFASTDTFLAMLGFDNAEIARIKAEEQKVRGLATLNEMGIE